MLSDKARESKQSDERNEVASKGINDNIFSRHFLPFGDSNNEQSNNNCYWYTFCKTFQLEESGWVSDSLILKQRLIENNHQSRVLSFQRGTEMVQRSRI
jgi:hypothetical protein